MTYDIGKSNRCDHDDHEVKNLQDPKGTRLASVSDIVHALNPLDLPSWLTSIAQKMEHEFGGEQFPMDTARSFQASR